MRAACRALRGQSHGSSSSSSSSVLAVSAAFSPFDPCAIALDVALVTAAASACAPCFTALRAAGVRAGTKSVVAVRMPPPRCVCSSCSGIPCPKPLPSEEHGESSRRRLATAPAICASVGGANAIVASRRWSFASRAWCRVMSCMPKHDSTKSPNNTNSQPPPSGRRGWPLRWHRRWG